MKSVTLYLSALVRCLISTRADLTEDVSNIADESS